MFETSGTTDVMEKGPWRDYMLWFAAGCLVTVLIFYIFVIPIAKRGAAESAEKAAKQKFSLELAMNPLDAQLVTTKAALQTASQERDDCKAKFDRQTFLYDNTIVVDPEKMWIIPADVEPIAVADRRLTYTHYDLKTKRETAHFEPKRQ
ncbi:MAG: hypothetical protein ACLPLR_16770 [Terriglobales bacterium]